MATRDGRTRRRDVAFGAQPDRFKLGDAPVSAQYEAQMQAVMHAVDDFLNGEERPRRIGCVILFFPFGDEPGRCNFMSNGADRSDLVKLMEEMIARFKEDGA